MTWCFKGTDEQALEEAMEMINKLRSSELYHHDNQDCSKTCKEKGWFGSNLHTMSSGRYNQATTQSRVTFINYHHWDIKQIPNFRGRAKLLFNMECLLNL